MVISEKSCSTESIFVIIGTDSLWILVTLKVGLQKLGYMLFKKKKKYLHSTRSNLSSQLFHEGSV